MLIYKKLRQIFCIIVKIKPNLNEKTLLMLYHSLFMTHIRLFLRTRGMTHLILRSQVFEDSNCFGSKGFNWRFKMRMKQNNLGYTIF